MDELSNMNITFKLEGHKMVYLLLYYLYLEIPVGTNKRMAYEYNYLRLNNPNSGLERSVLTRTQGTLTQW